MISTICVPKTSSTIFQFHIQSLMSMFPLKMKLVIACADQVTISTIAVFGKKAEMPQSWMELSCWISCCDFTESKADHSSTTICTWEEEE